MQVFNHFRAENCTSARRQKYFMESELTRAIIATEESGVPAYEHIAVVYQKNYLSRSNSLKGI